MGGAGQKTQSDGYALDGWTWSEDQERRKCTRWVDMVRRPERWKCTRWVKLVRRPREMEMHYIGGHGQKTQRDGNALDGWTWSEDSERRKCNRWVELIRRPREKEMH